MIPVSLKLSNFTSYGENVPELDFTKFHLAAISGPNGAGKSSLLDAITWCIWGTSRAGDSADQLVHSGSQNMNVSFSFELDNHKFEVLRARSLKSGGVSALEFWSGPNNLTEGTIKATQEKIINTLHLTFETFTNSSFLRQGHADEFTVSGPTDRKRILADILGLSHYDNLEEKAKDRVKDLQAKLKLLEYQVLEIEAELSQKDVREKEFLAAQKQATEIELQIKSLEENLKILQKEKEILAVNIEQRQKLSQNLEVQKKELSQIILQGKERAERIKNLELAVKNLGQIDTQINRLKFLQKEAEILKEQGRKKLELEVQVTGFQSKINLANQQRKTLQDDIEKIENQLKDLEKPLAKCPTCGQEIGKDQKHKVLEELRIKNKELRVNLSEIKTKAEETEIKKIETMLAALKVNPEKLEDLEKSILELEKLQSEKEKLLQDSASLETEKKTVEELRALFKTKETQVKNLEDELKKLPQSSLELSKISHDLMGKETSLQNLRSQGRQTQNLLGQAKELLSRSQQLEKLAKQKSEEKQNLEKEKEVFEELALAFGKKGIQAMIIETAIPEIEDGANRLLERLTSGRMNVRLQTQRETKTKLSDGEKGIVETLDIIISDEMGERPYENYSGGEQFRVNFAIRIALSKLLTRRAGAKLQFLVIDEGFGTQDVEGRTKIVAVLDAIKNDFEKILIITHLEELKEEFPVRIEVSKNSGGSTFEVVGD